MARALFYFALLSIVPSWKAAERVDNVLVQLVPPDSVSLFGARMQQLKATPLFRQLLAQQKLTELDRFTMETGFDPRRDVRDLLIAWGNSTGSSVLLARGTFHLSPDALAKVKDAHRSQYRGYTIWSSGSDEAGFCIMDPTLAIAGSVSSLRRSLDQYQSSHKTTAASLLERAYAVPAEEQIWAVSIGGADFLAEHFPALGGAANFSQILRGLENTSFQADLSKGFQGTVQGTCRTSADAKNLSDAARGLIGFGRLNVPDNHPEMLQLWDGIQVQQDQKQIHISANIPQDLVNKLAALMTLPTPPRPPRPPVIPRKQ